jgi:hypothetical protein
MTFGNTKLFPLSFTIHEVISGALMRLLSEVLANYCWAYGDY